MAHTFSTFFVVISLAPGAGFAETVRPEMDGVAQELVTGPTNFGFLHPAGLIIDRRGAGKGLEHLMVSVAPWIVANGRQQSRGQNFLGSGQTAKKVAIRVLFKELFNLLAVLLELLVQRAQEFAEAHRQL